MKFVTSVLKDALIESYEAHYCLDCGKIVSVSSYLEHSANHTLRAITVIDGHWRNRLLELIEAAKALQI